jgi:PhnB protein
MPPQDDMPPVPDEMKNKIMHIGLPISKETILMGSDTAEGFGPPFQAGNNFSISLSADSKEMADKFFNGLSKGGTVVMPMNKTFWSDYFGMLTDQFGINWMVDVGTPKK